MTKSRSVLQTSLYAVEAAALGMFMWLGGCIPAKLVPRFGAAIGALAGRLDRRRIGVALANLERAYGDELDASERRAIARAYYAYMGRCMMETQVVVRRHPAVSYHEYFEFENEHHMWEPIERHGAAIFVTFHGGPFELLGAAISERVTPLHSVFRPMQNPWLNRRLAEFRRKLGTPMIRNDDRALAQMLRLLKAGSSVGLLADLNWKRGGVFVDFFGVPAATMRVPGLLAVRCGVPIVFVAASLTDTAYRYRCVVHPPIYAPEEGSTDDKILAVMREVNAATERAVRANPKQWQWNYKRWKTRPPDAAAPAPEVGV